jgi:lipoxygenase
MIELQAWYSESCSPKLKDNDNLVSVLTILILNASVQHAALSFGQYPCGGYMPNRPLLMRRLIPEERDPKYASFISDPQKNFLNALPRILDYWKLQNIWLLLTPIRLIRLKKSI